MNGFKSNWALYKYTKLLHNYIFYPPHMLKNVNIFILQNLLLAFAI